jgi:hypothetical protein
MSSPWRYFPEWIVVLGISAASVLVPIVLAVLLTIWLINKKRRDDLMIQRLIEIKQTLEGVREALERRFGGKE